MADTEFDLGKALVAAVHNFVEGRTFDEHDYLSARSDY